VSGKKQAPKWDTEALRAQSVAQSVKVADFIDEADRRSCGTWYRLPAGTEDWHYVRCGLRGTDGALHMAWRLGQFGYVEAHPSVRLAGFERDGDRMLIVCAPPESAGRMFEHKAKQRAKATAALRKSFDSDMGALANIGDVTVTGGEGVGTFADFDAAALRRK